MKLSDLKPGEVGIVSDVGGSGSIHRRLLSMGILPGTIIKVARLSPLGDPIEYEIRGFFVSLRRNEANYVEVDKVVLLALIPPNNRVRIVLLDGGVGFIRNLERMGISIGKEIEIIRGCCPMTVKTEYGIFTVGRGIAYRIYVR